jgi:hypothetical protein
MSDKKFNDRDEQAAWELLGRHESIEPSFGFVERTLRRLDEETVRQLFWWQLPVLRWASSLALVAIMAGGAFYWQRTREIRRVEVYAAVHQDSLDDYDVIANLDQLNPARSGVDGGNQL